MAYKEMTRKPVVRKADKARGISALVADLGMRVYGSHRLRHYLIFMSLTLMPSLMFTIL